MWKVPGCNTPKSAQPASQRSSVHGCGVLAERRADEPAVLAAVKPGKTRGGAERPFSGPQPDIRSQAPAQALLQLLDLGPREPADIRPRPAGTIAGQHHPCSWAEPPERVASRAGRPIQVAAPLLGVREARLGQGHIAFETGVVGGRHRSQQPMSPAKRGGSMDAGDTGGTPDGKRLKHAVTEAWPAVESLQVSHGGAGQIAEGLGARRAAVALAIPEAAPLLDATRGAVGAGEAIGETSPPVGRQVESFVCRPPRRGGRSRWEPTQPTVKSSFVRGHVETCGRGTPEGMAVCDNHMRKWDDLDPHRRPAAAWAATVPGGHQQLPRTQPRGCRGRIVAGPNDGRAGANADRVRGTLGKPNE